MKSINKVVGLVFGEIDRCPQLIVKLARVDESVAALDREADNLRAVEVLHPDRVSGIPQLLFSYKWAGRTILGETALTGKPLYTLLQRNTCRDLALKVTDWLASLAGHSSPCARDNWWERLVEKTIVEFEQNFGQVLDPGMLQTTRAMFATLGDLPLVYEHRDCSPWNVLITDDGELVLLDWESAEPRGLPILDLTYFLTYLIFFLDGAMESQRFREGYRAARAQATFPGSIVTECEQRYLASLNLDPNVLRPLRLLTWMIHANSSGRRRSMFVSLWEEELVHESTDR